MPWVCNMNNSLGLLISYIYNINDVGKPAYTNSMHVKCTYVFCPRNFNSLLNQIFKSLMVKAPLINLCKVIY